MAFGEISLEIQEEVQFVSLKRFHEEIDPVKNNFKTIRSHTVKTRKCFAGLSFLTLVCIGVIVFLEINQVVYYFEIV